MRVSRVYRISRREYLKALQKGAKSILRKEINVEDAEVKQIADDEYIVCYTADERG